MSNEQKIHCLVLNEFDNTLKTYSTARKNSKLGENIKEIVPVIKLISVKNKLLLQKFHTHFRYLYKLV